MRRFYYTLTLLCLFFAVGCGNAVIVKGIAKMADGTAVEEGTVYFYGEKNDMYTASINGCVFRPGVVRDGDGIPPGVYSISVVGGTKEVPNLDPNSEHYPEPNSVSLIHSKYGNQKTSGLTLDTRQSKTLDLVLDPAE